MKVSLCIPSFNSSIYIEELLKKIQSLNFIFEVIICDDFSNLENINTLKTIVNNFKKSSSIPVKLILNDINEGAYVNKFKTVQQSSGNIIYLIDSDNLPMENFDKLIQKLINNFDKDTIYFPFMVYQFKTFPKLAKLGSILQDKYKVKFFDGDRTINFSDTQKYLKQYEQGINTFSIDKNIIWFLNVGNFIVDRDLFLSIFEPGLKLTRDKLAVDAIGFSYFWLKSGRKIKSLNNFYHYHRKRMDSVSFMEKENYNLSKDYFLDLFTAGK